MNEKNVEVKINENDIVPAQVIKVNNKTITLKTEDNEIITVDRPKSTIKDKLFLKTMIDILHSGIWSPVNKKLKQLLRYDWFDSLEDYQFLLRKLNNFSIINNFINNVLIIIMRYIYCIFSNIPLLLSFICNK